MTVIEFRQYTLHPGRRDELIELFEREFVESQELLGMRVIGTFRDLRDPDRFVWLRAFVDMAGRREALAAFYGGPVWREHGPAANATMIDSDDVRLLEPVSGEFAAVPRAAVGARPGPSRVLALVRVGADTELPDLDVPLVTLRTAPYANDYPALPIREEPAAVAFARYPDATALHAGRTALAGTEGVELLELEPTGRSTFR